MKRCAGREEDRRGKRKRPERSYKGVCSSNAFSASIFTCPVMAWMLRVLSAAICFKAAVSATTRPSEGASSCVLDSALGALELDNIC
jgi:hypothetical protein